LLLAIQVAFTFAVLVNVYAMVDAYDVQIDGESGYVDEPSLLGVTVRPFITEEINDDTAGRYRNQIERDLAIMKAAPGVKDVALAHAGVPFMNSIGNENFDQIRRTDQDQANSVPNTRYSADVNTLSLLGLELVAGRDFSTGDVRWINDTETDGGPAVIITQTLADVLFPDESAVGQQVVIQSGRVLNVIGVVRLAKAVYWAPYDDYASFTAGRVKFNQNYIIRLDRSEAGDFQEARASMIQTLTERLSAEPADREIKVETMAALKKVNLGRYIIINSIVGAVALLLIFVTALGNYGQMSYTILKRKKQIGIRRALGASRQYILNYFLIENGIVTLLGLIPGVVLMLGLNSVILNAMGYGQFKWHHIVVCTVFLFAVSLIAALIPIFRAMQIPPAIATKTV
jgi:putative ABC transport system permease protein